MVRDILASAGGATEDKLYPEDVFATYLHTGNGSTQTINNGIDLAGKGGLVWIKPRNDSTTGHVLTTNISTAKNLQTNNTNAAYNTSYEVNFNGTGFSYSGEGPYGTNAEGKSCVSWTFRKAPKFFDVVTWTGDGVAGRQIPHSLGCEVGMIVLKCTSNSTDWVVYHRFLGATKRMFLNTTDSQITNSLTWNNTEPTSNNFTLGTSGAVNGDGLTYVAYLFAHDPSADGIIQCGSFTTDASGNATVNLGWEPQYLMVKGTHVYPWVVVDSMRGMPATDNAANYLKPNTSDVEGASGPYAQPTATGFVSKAISASSTFIYLAIRRPMKVPTSGTEVYNAVARTGTGVAATVSGVGFAPDLALISSKNAPSYGIVGAAVDRLRGAPLWLATPLTQAETNDSTAVSAFGIDGISVGTVPLANYNTGSYINHFFKRAKGFMDIVCYTGTGVARTVPHGLGVAPELMIVKDRLNISNWGVWHKDIFTTNPANILILQLANAATSGGAAYFNSTAPTSTGFTVGDASATNGSSGRMVAYLFASLPAVSKIFSYVGNGTSQNIECGFTTGARFIMVKASSTTGDWLIADTVRGVTAGSDPRLSLNTTAAEVITEDWVDNYAGGFTVNQVAGSNANVNGVTYIGMAIA